MNVSSNTIDLSLEYPEARVMDEELIASQKKPGDLGEVSRLLATESGDYATSNPYGQLV